MEASQSTVGGQGEVVLPPQPGEPVLTATITIKRAATGEVETYTLTGTLVEPTKEQ